MSTTQQTQLVWTSAYTRPDHNVSVLSGIDSAVDGDTKFYRAWAQAAYETHENRFESAIYEACDSADAQLPAGYTPLLTHQRDRIIAQASQVRTLMRADQRSYKDMEQIALCLHADAVQEYRQWEQAEQARKVRQVEDEKAMLLARQFIRGLVLLAETGTSDEKRLISQLFKK